MGFSTTSSPGTVVRAIAPALILGSALVGSALGRPEVATGMLPLLGMAVQLGSGTAPTRPAPALRGGSHKRPMVH